MGENDWKSRLGVVFSTNPQFDFNSSDDGPEEETLPNEKQKVIVALDKRNRGGKQVTLVTGFKGSSEDLEKLAKILKAKCGTGGSAKDGQIIIQGDMRDKVLTFLLSLGYKAKRGN